MNNQLQIFKNEKLNLQARAIKNEDGSISIDAEDTAIGLGWIDNSQRATNGSRLLKVRWARMNKYCKEYGFPIQLGKGDFIPESLFYLLAMKANNKVAKEFQKWLAVEVIPQIRKTGSYQSQQKPDNIYPELTPEIRAIFILDSRTKQLQTEFNEYKDNQELSVADSKRLTKLVNKTIVNLLGGKGSEAYKKLNKKAFSDLYKQIHREFNVTSIAEIKQKDIEIAKEIISKYKAPIFLINEIKMMNNQETFIM